jgi:signal transduction histidine kinase
MISELKRSRDSIEEWTQTLEQRVRERTQELQRVQDQLIHAGKMAALGELSNSIAHEIKNPLTSIGGFARRLDRSIPEEVPEKRYTQTIIKEVSRLERILNDLLKYTRDESLVLKELDLRDILDITRYLRHEKFDILNVHHSHGHILGGIAARRCGHPVLVIRTDHKRDPLKPSLGNRFLISRYTDGMIVFSERARREDAEHFGLPVEG